MNFKKNQIGCEQFPDISLVKN